MSWPAPVEVLSVRISTRSGAVHILAESGRHEVLSSTGPIATGRPVTIDGGSSKVEVRVPVGTDLVVGTTSGRITIEGRVGAVSALTKSGRIDVEHAESVDARTAAGRVVVGRVDGECRVVAASARVEIGHCGGADVTTRSGRIIVKDATGSVRAHCTSGRIDVELAGAHDVVADTVSGRVAVVLPAGVEAFVARSPEDARTTTATHDCVVVARSVSGRVTVVNR